MIGAKPLIPSLLTKAANWNIASVRVVVEKAVVADVQADAGGEPGLEVKGEIALRPAVGARREPERPKVEVAHTLGKAHVREERVGQLRLLGSAAGASATCAAAGWETPNSAAAPSAEQAGDDRPVSGACGGVKAMHHTSSNRDGVDGVPSALTRRRRRNRMMLTVAITI